ncbi:hypothetical protein HLK66_04755 [Niallia circulans]|uniref:hypothetical protein n=1 Tax=Niallia circulans TaxID=1397 RepID=UPI00148FC51E|nr:hypothetical protein [Niallia circulans]QJX61023.1 hypothetical protein HLK66_04755 [Niallia circulans]
MENRTFSQIVEEIQVDFNVCQSNIRKMIENSERMTEILQEMSKFLEEKNGDE